ncbi:hypothetical protein D3C75_951960 [compost metagenome]
MEDAEQRFVAPARVLAPGAGHYGLVQVQAQGVGIDFLMDRAIAVLSHFLADSTDLRLHGLVHELDVGQVIQRAQANDQAEQLACRVEHEVVVAAA